MTNNNQGNAEFNKNLEELYLYHFEVKFITGKRVGNTCVIKLKGLNDDKKNKKQNSLASCFKMVRGKFNKQLEDFSTDDWVQEFSYLFSEGAYKLDELESLEYLLANPDIYAKRITFITNHIIRGFQMIANPDTVIIKTNGTRFYLDVTPESIDKETGENFSILHTLREEDNILFQEKSGYKNHMMNWLYENKDEILTNKQNEVFTKLQQIYSPLTDGGESQDDRNRMLDELGMEMTNSKINQMFKNIKKRVTKKYNEEFNGMQSRTMENNRALRQTLESYITEANEPNRETPTERQEALTKIVVDNYDNEAFELVVTKGLKLEDKKEIVRVANGKQLMSHRVIRLVKDIIEKHLEEVKLVEITPSEVEFEYRENIFSGLGSMPSKTGRLNANGSIEFRNEDGDWEMFER